MASLSIVQPRPTPQFWQRQLQRLERARSDAPQPRQLAAAYRKWSTRTVQPWLRENPERKSEFRNRSGIVLQRLYTPRDVARDDYLRDQGFPGAYPFTRGVYPTMHRGRFWTMRMFSGYGGPEETNRRLKYLLEQGETGLSIAFDMPTLYGYDADHERARGEVGRCGVNVSSLQDMEVVLAGIPLDQVSTSMTINAPAPVVLAMYAAVALQRGIPLTQLRGTVQADILKEYIAQKEWAFPPEAHLRLIRDMMVFCTREMPQWNYLSISGYHIREAGANAVQELALTLADGFAYVDLGVQAGLSIEQFAPRLSFFFNCDIDFFEEIAKFRAARRIWATVLREKYGVRNPRALMLRFHTQTSGASLTWQQPLNNVVRTAIEALAGVLGGTQSLHTNAHDEAWALPMEEAAMLALRTQQIIAEETGVGDVVDPLGGSYYVEWLTAEMEARVYRSLDQIDALGGILPAIRTGYIQREIAQTAYEAQRGVERGDTTIVGVNKYVVPEQSPIRTLKIDDAVQRRQVERLRAVRRARDAAKVHQALGRLRKAFESPEVNCMPSVIEAVRAQATLGEIMDVGRGVYGEWREPALL
jgi:methylmalonyl-CoA mutase N-terminal domain/subunit